MKKTISVLVTLLFICNCFSSYGQNNDSIVNILREHVMTVNYFSHYVPQEKVYLHFDNNSYYEKDKIWFKCYVVASTLNKPDNLSKTLYVDLLNPGGEIVEKKVLEIKDGQCNGSFTLDKPAFYSGFFEVRAYTKYMLNFGEDAIFSRVFPVFKQPEEEGNFVDRQMQKVVRDYPMKRKKISKDKKINVKFYPEGGNLIVGVESRVAFQATDEYGQPINVTGSIAGVNGGQPMQFSTIHGGRGVFLYTPSSDNEQKAEIVYEDKKTSVDLPEALSQGYAMVIDNLSHSDKVGVSIKKNSATAADILGVAVLCGGTVCHLDIVNFYSGDEAFVYISKKAVPASGVTQIALFNKEGNIFCDRLIFVDQKNNLTIKNTQSKESYEPYEKVDLMFTVADKDNTPVNTSFSLSVRDVENDVYYSDNIQTNLLLSSEIKGYIHNPAYYFEADDLEHRQALDLLLMVQGWRRYRWAQMAGLESFDMKYAPEQGVEVQGFVKSKFRNKIKPGMDVSLYLGLENKERERTSKLLTAKTDSMGQFKIVSDLYGKWDMVLGTSEKGKKKRENIYLDRLFRPASKAYTYPELQVKLTKNESSVKDAKTMIKKEDIDAFLPLSDDSLNLGMDQKVHQLDEVTVETQKLGDRYKTRAEVYYDSAETMNDIIDGGGFIIDDVNEYLLNIDPNFRRIHPPYEGDLDYRYKNCEYLTVIKKSRSEKPGRAQVGGNSNHRHMVLNKSIYSKFNDSRKVENLTVMSIKSVFICELKADLLEYIESDKTDRELIDNYRFVVFIETYPEGEIPNGAKGIRKLKLEGYDLQTEFFSPDYSDLPKDVDYRRTLYWNPDVKTDSKGEAEVQFYNNSSCRRMVINAETMTSDGKVGVYSSY